MKFFWWKGLTKSKSYIITTIRLGMYTMYMNKIFVCYIFNFGNYLKIFFHHTYCKLTHSLKWSIFGKNNFEFVLNRFGKNLIQVRKLIVMFKLIIKSHISCIWSPVSDLFLLLLFFYIISCTNHVQYNNMYTSNFYICFTLSI